SAVDNIARILAPKGFSVEEFEIAGLTEIEFAGAVASALRNGHLGSMTLTEEHILRLYKSTGGLPLAVQIMVAMAGSPSGGDSRLIWPDEIDLPTILKEWRQRAIKEGDLRDVLFVFANVPRIGLSEQGIAYLLDWQVDRVNEILLKLYRRGFLS